MSVRTPQLDSPLAAAAAAATAAATAAARAELTEFHPQTAGPKKL